LHAHTNTQEVNNNDLPNLDLLRATAVLIVYFAHLLMTYGLDKHWTAFSIYVLSQAGVTIFFVHTAFVLMLSLERQNNYGFSWFCNFYIRRIFRIYPLSCLTVLFVLALSIPAFPTETFRRPTLAAVITNLTLTQNLVKLPAILNVLWSLPYEIQMYLVLPFLFILVRKRPVWVPIALWIIAALTLALEIKGLGLLNYVPCFLGGVVAYRLWRAPKLNLNPWLWPLAIILTIIMHLILPAKIAAWCASLFLGISIPQFGNLASTFFNWTSAQIAKYSYGIYLSHTIVFSMLIPGNPVKMAALSMLVPVVLFHLLEHPMIEMGKRTWIWIEKVTSPVTTAPKTAQNGLSPN